MSVNINILKAVERFLIEKAKNNDRDYSYFHVSGWDYCHRQIAYLYYESQKIISIDDSALKLNPNQERIFDNGHYLHFRWRDYLIGAAVDAVLGRWLCLNLEAHTEPKIHGLDSKLGCTRPDKCECGSDRFEYLEVGFRDEETMWGGHVDCIIDIAKWPYVKLGEYKNALEIPIDEGHFVVDYKSINPFEFKTLEKPKSEHMTQMQLYLYLSGLKFGKFIYENKANQNVKEYFVLRDDALIAVKREEAIALKYQVTHTNTENQHVLPPRGYDSRGHTKCLECKFRGHCWGSTRRRN